MKRFLALTAVVVALSATGCSSCGSCRQTLINWGWFNRGSSCDTCSSGGYADSGYAGGSGAMPCSTSEPYTSQPGPSSWTAPRGGVVNYGEAELVPPGTMNIVPRG